MKVYLGLGSNLGARERTLWRAITELRRHLDDVRVSPFYESRPQHVLDQPPFLNLALEGSWSGTLPDLLSLAKRLEVELGRVPRERFGPREVDIDILAFDNIIHEDERLTVPHPRLTKRLFALRPLADLAPDLIVPGIDRSVRELLEQHPDHSTLDRSCWLHQPTINHADLNDGWWILQAFEHMQSFVLRQAIDPNDALQLIDKGRAFLRSPEARSDPHRKIELQGSGYTPPFVERVANEAPDGEREFFDLLAPGICSTRLPYESHPAFSAVSLRVRSALKGIAMRCFERLDAHLGTTLAADARDGAHMLRCSRYFAQQDRTRVIFPAHRDFGLMTIFGGGTARGLEGGFEGVWHPIAALDTPGSVMVGVGNTLKLYLPQLQGWRHRVTAANTSTLERFSYSLFTEPRADVLLPNGELASIRLKRSVRRIRQTHP